MLGEHGEQEAQALHRVRVDEARFLRAVEILQSGGVGIGRTLIRLAGRDPVHDHLRQIPPRHLDRLILPRGRIDVRPVFKMVLVAALVVHPRLGIPLGLALGGVGAAVALILADARPEFDRRIFGQVVCQALPVKPHAEAAVAHESAVMRDGFEMLPDIAHGPRPPF